MNIGESKDLLFTAEALSHIRVINIVLEFPENVYKPVLKLLNTYSISLEYKGALLIIFLPDETEKDASIRINQQFNRVLSIRLPLNNSSIKSVEEISPWSAVYIDSNSDFCCAFCSSLLLSKNQIKYWKNLPSDNWIDMVDYWVCHGGKQDILAKLGIDSDIKFVSRVGTVFVGLSYFLVSQENMQNIKIEENKIFCDSCQMDIGILTENGIKLYKWKLIEKNIARTISFDIDTFISAELLALIKIHANHKFDIYSEDSKKCVIKIWVFNSDLRITNGLFCESDININNTYNKFPGIRVMKICYILIKDASVELDGNNVVFHSEMVKSLLCLLKKSNSSIPKIIRQFGIWNIGYLKRYD